MAMKKRFYSVNGQMMACESGGVKKDFITDHLGSITAEMDQSQTRTYDARYSAYGKSLWSTGTNSGFGWVGSFGYRETGISHMSHYVRARHYSYVTGGWSTVDPLWPNEKPFGYANSNPISNIDPSGLASFRGTITCFNTENRETINTMCHKPERRTYGFDLDRPGGPFWCNQRIDLIACPLYEDDNMTASFPKMSIKVDQFILRKCPGCENWTRADCPINQTISVTKRNLPVKSCGSSVTVIYGGRSISFRLVEAGPHESKYPDHILDLGSKAAKRFANAMGIEWKGCNNFRIQGAEVRV